MRRVTYLLDSPNDGGAESYLVQLLNGLSTNQESAVVATRPAPGILVAAAGDRLLEVDPVGTDRRRVPAIASSVWSTGPDVVHVNLIDPASNCVLIQAACEAGAPAVATCHMVGALPDRARLRAAYAGLEAVIAVSREIAGLLRTGLDLDRDAVHVISPGVAPLHPTTRARTGPIRIGAVGRLTAQKGFDLLIDAARRLAAAGHDVDVVIAGEGRDRAALEALAEGSPVHVLGQVRDIPGFLASLDVLCLPSRAEGLPYALLEAMSAGLPCVAADVGDIRAAVGNAVIVVPPENVNALVSALQRLIVDAPLRRHLGSTSAALVRERFTIDRMLEATAGVYETVVAAATHATSV